MLYLILNILQTTLGSSIFTLDTFITAGKYVLNFTKCAACFMFECQDWNIHSIFRPWKMPSNIFFLISALLTDSIIANGANLQTVLRTHGDKGFSGRIIRPTDSVKQQNPYIRKYIYDLRSNTCRTMTLSSWTWTPRAPRTPRWSWWPPPRRTCPQVSCDWFISHPCTLVLSPDWLISLPIHVTPRSDGRACSDPGGQGR